MNPIVAPPPEPAPVPNESNAPLASAPAPRPIPPRYLAVGAAILCLLGLLVFLGRKSWENPAGAPPQPTASIAASTPVPSPTAVVQQEVPSVTPLPSVAEIPTASPVRIPSEEYDLAALIASAAPGATIKVRPGTYTSLTLTRPVKLVGDPSAPVFFKGEGQSALTVQSPGVSLQNIQILTNGIGTLPAVAIADGAAVEMKAVGIQSTTEIGILVNGKASLKALGTTFAVPNGAGLRLKGPGHATPHAVQFLRQPCRASMPGAARQSSCIPAPSSATGGSNGHGSIIALSGPRHLGDGRRLPVPEQRRRAHR